MVKRDSCCCVHIATSAALTGVLQAVAVVMLLSTSAVLLARWRTWKTDFERDLDQANMLQGVPKSSTESLPFSTTRAPQNANGSALEKVFWFVEERSKSYDVGLEAFVEIHLAHHIAFYSLWIVFLFVYAFAFKSGRPALVVPNVVMQFISLILIAILAGALIARLVHMCKQYHNTDDMALREDIGLRYALHTVLLAALVIVAALEILFAIVGVRFYLYLRDRHQSVYPDVPVVTFPVSSIITAYPNGQQQQQAPIIAVEPVPKYGRADDNA